MATHPLDAILAPGVSVVKSSTVTELKKYARDWGTAANFRTYDLPNVLLAIIDGKVFEYDPLDLSTADDGVTCILDASSRRFKRIASEVSGPASATDNAIVRFDGTSGKQLQNSGSTLSDAGILALVNLLDISNGSSGQIKFPSSQNASADANTLDDYEEGTWTPALFFGAGNTGLTYNYRLGYYTKLGNLCSIWCHFLLTAKGSSTGVPAISGLPFTCGASVSATGAVTSFSMSSLVDGITAVINAATAYISLYTGSATGSANMSEANFGNTSMIFTTVSYRI